MSGQKILNGHGQQIIFWSLLILLSIHMTTFARHFEHQKAPAKYVHKFDTNIFHCKVYINFNISFEFKRNGCAFLNTQKPCHPLHQ